ncbi:hypothetical protein ACJIZ3_006192 [Penstemon smallii]|uniref:Uncharacterized protein n=1 Tax=Penstemon smallii TaxID=265156 RepID=A0ABD3S748_9LAMI
MVSNMWLDLQVVVLYLFKLLFLVSKVVLQTFKFVSRVSSTYELRLFQLKLQAFSIDCTYLEVIVLCTQVDEFGLFKLMLFGFIASSSQVDYLCYFESLLFASKSTLHICSSNTSLFLKIELPSS